MNVASLERCKELYELAPSWLGAPSECTSSSCMHHGYYDNGRFICPKYDLGYLLDKLKPALEKQSATERLATFDLLITLENPADGLARLAIELFKQGILKKEKS